MLNGIGFRKFQTPAVSGNVNYKKSVVVSVGRDEVFYIPLSTVLRCFEEPSIAGFPSLLPLLSL